MTASMTVSFGIGGDRPLLGAMVLFKSSLLWSTLDESDTLALYLLAARTIIPVTRIANKATEISKLYHSAKGSVKGAAASTHHLLQPTEWKLRKDSDGCGFILCESTPSSTRNALPPHTTSSGQSTAESQEGCPLLHLQAGRDACRMLTWQQHGLQVRCLCCHSLYLIFVFTVGLVIIQTW